MLKLIRMEMKKQKLAWFFRGAVIATILCAGFMFLIAYPEGSRDPAFGSFADIAYTEGG
ncbi:ABC transporter permease, partial [Clostridium perfringens]